MEKEALARVTAEAELRKRHRPEHERYLTRYGPVEGVVKLVARYKNEYGDLVKEAKARHDAMAAARAAAEDVA